MHSTTSPRSFARYFLLLGLAGLFVLAPRSALAQRTTGTVTVEVSATGGAVPPGVKVDALNTATGTTIRATPRADGSFVLSGLEPGEYLITAAAPSGTEVNRLVQVEIGQSSTLDLQIETAATPTQAAKGEVIVVKGRLNNNATSEIGTNVSREQLENLPQNDRNFLNFAQLAPGVRLSNNEFNRNFSSGALEASSTNVFVDGVSLKNNITEGGIAGQDASRGNPFPQLAVGGFRVITQNYKAEYEQAGAAIISSYTRSGTNTYHGDIFTSFQNEDLMAKDYYLDNHRLPPIDPPPPPVAKPDLTRYQFGADAGGPIIKDKLFVFLTYEGNYQNRNNQVVLGNPTPENIAQFGQYEGGFQSPFREQLGFGKFTYKPNPSQNLEVSGSLRHETDIRSFGAATSFEAAENVKNDVITTMAKHQWWLGSALNEATFQFLNSTFNPTAENIDLVGQDYEGVLRIGGRDTNQNIRQRSFTLRDDVTFSDLDLAGQHVVKTGAKVTLQNYHVEKALFGNPLFRYRQDSANGLDFSAPAEASYGVGDPLVESDNTQIGLYAQDDWQIGRKLTLNLGVRWDIETNMLNNDYVTPDAVRAAVTELAGTVSEVNGPKFFPVDNYLTDGNDRPLYLGAVQPRIGAAYDVMGDGSTVVFGGAGRYYDRQLFNNGLDELYRLQYEVRTFRFSQDGAMRDGQPTIAWDPSYLSRAGLQGLIDQGVAPNPEIFLLENDTKPLRSDQFSAGFRQSVGPVNTTVTVTHIRSANGLGFYPANRQASGTRDFLPVPGNFGNVLVSVDDRKSRYTSLQVAVDKPYSDELSGSSGIRWGASLAYTLASAKERGSLFNFDFATVKASPLVPTAADERHRVVMSGIVGLPLDFKLSSLIQIGSGVPYTIFDNSEIGQPTRVRVNAGRSSKAIEFRQIDVRLAKDFHLLEGHRISAFIEAFNIFNWRNVGGFDGFVPASDQPANPNYGRATKLVGPPFSMQLGVGYSF